MDKIPKTVLARAFSFCRQIFILLQLFCFSVSFLFCRSPFVLLWLFLFCRINFCFAVAFLFCHSFFVLLWLFYFAAAFLFCRDFFILPWLFLICRGFSILPILFCFAVAILFCREFFILPWIFCVVVVFALPWLFVLPWLFCFVVAILFCRDTCGPPQFCDLAKFCKLTTLATHSTQCFGVNDHNKKGSGLPRQKFLEISLHGFYTFISKIPQEKCMGYVFAFLLKNF